MKTIIKFLKENFMYILVGMLGTYVFMDFKVGLNNKYTYAIQMPYEQDNNGAKNYIDLPSKKSKPITKDNIKNFYQEF